MDEDDDDPDDPDDDHKLERTCEEGCERGERSTRNRGCVLINLAFPSTKCLFFHFSIIFFCSP